MQGNKIERIDLVLLNKPGVLDRIAGIIHREDLNIKHISASEFGDGSTSSMVLVVEGTRIKINKVNESLLGLDCVVSMATAEEGGTVPEKNLNVKSEKAARPPQDVDLSAKEEGVFRILAINPGSTSTKFGLYDNETCVFQKSIAHDSANISGPILEQKEYRCACIMDCLKQAGLDTATLDAVAGRGGLLRPIPSGTYSINQKMIDDLHKPSAAGHASSLGALIAKEISGSLSIPSFIVDPVVVDEMDRIAKISGIPQIERTSIFHALNQKAIARRFAADIGMAYENIRLVIAHLGGGISVGAHKYGRVIDVSNGLTGEGPFTPERTGGIPATSLVNMCFSGEFTELQMNEIITRKGGMKAYLGTSDLLNVQKMIDDGDDFASIVYQAMAYQVAKEIGAMSAVLEGTVDAIILTGGLANSTRFTSLIKEKVDKFADVYVYQGEDELAALAEGTLRVLTGEEPPAEY